jgi:hypothetical protein
MLSGMTWSGVNPYKMLGPRFGASGLTCPHPFEVVLLGHDVDDISAASVQITLTDGTHVIDEALWRGEDYPFTAECRLV